MSAPFAEDLGLARRAAAGSAAAWDELIAAYGAKLYNVAVHFAGGFEDADDLTQEVFLRLHQNLGSYRGDVPLGAWALRLSRNLCIDRWRRVRSERRATVFSDELLAYLPAADDPAADAERRLQLRTVHRALARMNEDHAEVLVLRDLQGWSEEETATALGLPLGTVKSRLHRGRIELAALVSAALAPRVGETAAALAPRVAPVAAALPAVGVESC